MISQSEFPDPVYRETVLEPAFETVRQHFAPHIHAINRAHLIMLSETGILDRRPAGRIASALARIEDELRTVPPKYSEQHEDFFFLLEAELIARVGDIGSMLHIGRSRNDMDQTCFRMELRQRTEESIGLALHLAEKLLDRARSETQTLIVAYTHGQPAQPTTFCHYLLAVIEVLLRDTRRLESALAVVDQCPLGAAAITTTGFPIDRERVAGLLGFSAISLNAYACIAAVDYLTGLYSALKLVFLHLGRVTQDMVQWTSFEAGQLLVPDSLVQISSIMPQKRNPVPVEHLRHLCSSTVGRCDMIQTVMHNTPFADMNDSEADVQQAGFGAFDSGNRALALFAALLPSCRVDSDRSRSRIDAAYITVTELADTLVRKEAIAFRTAHRIAGQTSRAALEQGKTIAQAFAEFSEAFATIEGRPSGLTETQFLEVVSPDTFVARRDRPGGPAPAAVEAAMDIYSKELDVLQTNRTARTRPPAAGAETHYGVFCSLAES